MARKPKAPPDAPKPRDPSSAERRAAALRENLRRRKRQKRLRDDATNAPAKDEN